MKLFRVIAENGTFQVWADSVNNASDRLLEQEPTIKNVLYILPIDKRPKVLNYDEIRNLIKQGYDYEKIVKFDEIQERLLTNLKT